MGPKRETSRSPDKGVMCEVNWMNLDACKSKEEWYPIENQGFRASTNSKDKILLDSHKCTEKENGYERLLLKTDAYPSIGPKTKIPSRLRVALVPKRS